MRRLGRVLVCVFGLLTVGDVQADEAVWELLGRGGQVVMVRYALAPGVGDPANFDPADCSTQRNLNEAGRMQARRMGDAFRNRNIPIDQVLSSVWCRCAETARLAFGDVTVWPALNSFFRDRRTRGRQTDAVATRVAGWTGPGNLVLVTHQINVTALTNRFVQSGEAVVLTPTPSGFQVAGRLLF